MVNQISASESPIKLQKTGIEPSYAVTPYAKTKDYEQDSFSSEGSGVSKKELALGGASLAGIGSYLFVRKKAGNYLKMLDKNVDKNGLPKTLFGRLKKMFEFGAKDSMTGLLNKNSLEIFAQRGFAEAQKGKKDFSCAILDMDNFKSVNEEFGHEMGDTVLKRIAKNVNDVAQKHGLHGFRYGGEEFVILGPKKDSKEMFNIIEEVANSIKMDDEIQKLVKPFNRISKKELEVLNLKIKKLNSVFARLKEVPPTSDPRELAQDITKIILSNAKNQSAANLNKIKPFLQKLKKASPEELKSLLNINTMVTENSTLGNELNKIYTNSTDLKNDLQKWTNHISGTGKFTVSGGVAEVKSTGAKSGMELVKKADEALKISKESGKNRVTIAKEN